MNVLPGTIAQAAPDRAEVVLRDGTRVAARVDAGSAKAGDRISLGIRPEHTRLAPSGNAGTLSGTASHVEQLGEASYLYLESTASNGLLTVRQEGDTGITPGEAVAVALPEEHCHLFDAQGRAFARHMGATTVRDTAIAV